MRAFTDLCKHLEANTTLRKLIIANHDFDPQPMRTKALAKALCVNTTLESLDMYRLDLGEHKSADHFKTVFEENSSIRYLAFHQMDYQLGVSVACGLMSSSCQILRLDLSGSELGCQSDSVRLLSSAFCRNRSLRELNLSHNYFENELALDMCASFRRNASLVKLDLSFNFLEDDFLQNVQTTFAENTTIELLDVRKNRLNNNNNYLDSDHPTLTVLV
jgi:hypothetical protein